MNDLKHQKAICRYWMPPLFAVLAVLLLLSGTGISSYAFEEPEEAVIMQSFFVSCEGNEITVTAGRTRGLFLLMEDLDSDFTVTRDQERA